MSELESQLAASDAMYEELQTESIGKEEEIGVMGTPRPHVPTNRAACIKLAV